MKYIRKEEGFRNQELYVIPPAVANDSALSVLIRNFMVSDAGYFPSAAGHQKIRNEGIAEGILLYCVDGGGFVRIEDESTVFLKKRQAFYIPPGTVHIYGASDSNPWTLYWMHVQGELLDVYASVLKNHKGPVSLCSRTAEQADHLFAYLLETMKDGYSPDVMLKSGQLAAALFTSVLYGNKDFHRELSPSHLKRIDRIVRKMRDSLETGESMGLEDMAVYLDLSVPHFSEVFKKAKGYSPVEYYNRMKIQKACRLLEISNLDIQEIAAKCAYKDRYYFSRFFKKIMGLSPSTYREAANRPFGV